MYDIAVELTKTINEWQCPSSKLSSASMPYLPLSRRTRGASEKLECLALSKKLLRLNLKKHFGQFSRLMDSRLWVAFNDLAEENEVMKPLEILTE
jgi:hypothetical protein